jgi:diacylglycerol kinase family enzyme
MADGRPEQAKARASAVAGGRADAPPIRSRIAAGSALAVSVATLVVLIVFTAQNLLYVLGSLLAGALGLSALWIAATNRRFRWWAGAAAVLLVGGAVAILLAAGRGVVEVATVTAGIVVASALGTLALRWEVGQALAERWRQVPATRHGVILMNPRSGDGKVARLHLADEARRRGIEPVLLNQADDLRARAEAAVAGGADALGMAGGDGSQAVVAAVAAGHELPFVCIPAGTRNHLALDLGIDRDDPVGALDAFGPARETTIDLGEVNGEVFVNNVSLGLYARMVASEDYREAKRRTVAEMLPDLLGPDAAPSGLAVDGPGGPVAGPLVIQVSNNPYVLSSVTGFGSRARLNAGVLGVATLSINRTSDVNRLVAMEAAGHPERYGGWRQWTARDLEVRGPPSLAAAVDGEACTWEPPLRFVIRPETLRVRIALGQSGASPAFLHAPVAVSTLVGLARVVRGRPSGIVAHQASEA